MQVTVDKCIDKKANEFKTKGGFLYIMRFSGFVDGVLVSVIQVKTFDEDIYNGHKIGNTYEVEPDDRSGNEKHCYIIKSPPPKKTKKKTAGGDKETETLKIRAQLACSAMQSLALLAKKDSHSDLIQQACQAYPSLFGMMIDSVFGSKPEPPLQEEGE